MSIKVFLNRLLSKPIKIKYSPMKRKLILIVAGFCLGVCVNGQWTQSENILQTNNHVNIGVQSNVDSHALSVYRTLQISSINTTEQADICKLDFLAASGWPLNTYYGSGYSLQYNPSNASFTILQRVNTSGGQGSINNVFSINNSGMIGINTSISKVRLHVGDDDVITGGIAIGSGAVDGGNLRLISSVNHWNLDNYSGRLRFFTETDYGTGGIERMTINAIGNVLIGKTTQINNVYKLDVAGKIRADEIVVNTTGADFVFENNYKLRPLAEVETFIKQNKHLPDIKSAAQMQTDGVSMGEMQTKLLQKQEETMLYLIEQEKKNTALEEKLTKLEKENLELRQDVKELKESIKK
jgi:hypothetical protein